MRITLFRLMTELTSRKWIARLVGRFAKSRLSRFLIPQFAKIYSIDVTLAEKQLKDYKSLNEFFTRRLKAGVRPFEVKADVVLSPVDGKLIGMGHIEEEKILNIKGQDYSVRELLNNNPRLQKYSNGYYYILYLSPSDYHRIHAPVSGKIVEKEHVLGKLYPVHEKSLSHIRKVLSRNERLTTYIEHEYGEIAVVKVGAMNVSSIQYVDPSATEVKQGEELAYFEFGSTVVLLMQHNFIPNAKLQIHDKLLMGTILGTYIQETARK